MSTSHQEERRTTTQTFSVQQQQQQVSSSSMLNRSVSPANSGRHQRPDIAEFMQPANFADYDEEDEDEHKAGYGQDQNQHQQNHQQFSQQSSQFIQQQSSYTTTNNTSHQSQQTKHEWSSHNHHDIQQNQQSNAQTTHEKQSGRREMTLNTEFAEETVLQNEVFSYLSALTCNHLVSSHRRTFPSHIHWSCRLTAPWWAIISRQHLSKQLSMLRVCHNKALSHPSRVRSSILS
jgi:hypothetical protein